MTTADGCSRRAQPSSSSESWEGASSSSSTSSARASPAIRSRSDSASGCGSSGIVWLPAAVWTTTVESPKACSKIAAAGVDVLDAHPRHQRALRPPARRTGCRSPPRARPSASGRSAAEERPPSTPRARRAARPSPGRERIDVHRQHDADRQHDRPAGERGCAPDPRRERRRLALRGVHHSGSRSAVARCS